MEYFMIIYLIPLIYSIFQLCKLVLRWRDQCCYMLDYQCYKATDDRQMNTDSCAKVVLRNKNLGLDQYKFLLQTMVSSGIGEATYGPRNVILGKEENPTLSDAHSEVDEIIYDTLDKIFDKNKISPEEIDILVVNVSLLATIPSLTSRIINHYKMRSDIKTFNLSGMGCSASLVSIDILQHLFKTHKNSYAIVVSTESMGPNWYCGKEKSMMLSNCLFRAGGCSMLFTNNRGLKHKAIMKLKCVVRTHLGSDDEAYECCMQLEDDLGYRGFRLTKKLTKAAAKAFIMNLRVLVPKILPIWALLCYIYTSHRQRRSKVKNATMEAAGAGLDLKAGVEHFCLHPGGRAVIDGIEKSLGLSEYDVEPARMALHRFGNTSAGGLWYVLGYMEAKMRLKKRDRILMISLGAGFKCNNCLWEVMKDLEDVNVWKDCIDSYPPTTLANPFTEKYGWMNDECLNFIRFEKEAFLLQ